MLILLAMKNFVLSITNAVAKIVKILFFYFLKVTISGDIYLLVMARFIAKNFECIFNGFSDDKLSSQIIAYKNLI